MDGLSPQTVATKDVIPAARASAASASSSDVPTPRPRSSSATLRAISALRAVPDEPRDTRRPRVAVDVADEHMPARVDPREEGQLGVGEPRLRAAEARGPGLLAEPAEQREDRRDVAVSQRPDRDSVDIGRHA